MLTEMLYHFQERALRPVPQRINLLLCHFQERALRPVPQRINLLWNGPESPFIKA